MLLKWKVNPKKQSEIVRWAKTRLREMFLNLWLPAGHKTLVSADRHLCSRASRSLETLLISSFSISASLFLSARFQRGFYPPTKTHSQPHQKHTGGRLKSPWEARVQHLTKETHKERQPRHKCLQRDVRGAGRASRWAGAVSSSKRRRVVPKNCGENVTRVFKCLQ